MKVTIITLLLLPLTTFANPIAEPLPEASALALANPQPDDSLVPSQMSTTPAEEANLLVARDNVCHITTSAVRTSLFFLSLSLHPFSYLFLPSLPYSFHSTNIS
jgi:hypothetical protein